MSKKTMAISAIIAVLGSGALGASAVFAKGMPLHPGHKAGIINKIAPKLHLKSGADIQAEIKVKLTDAVKNGKLTQAQADMIAVKQTELQSFRAGLKGKSQADIQSAMKTEMDSLTQWAKDNNIPSEYIGFGIGHGQKNGIAFGKSLDPKVMLDKAVTDGKLTQAQEDLIISKQAEVKTFTDSLKTISSVDRQSAIKTETDSLKTWAQVNNIPVQYVQLFRGRMGHGLRK